MFKSSFLVIAALICLAPCSAAAQYDHLVPPRSDYLAKEPSYHAALAQVFPCPICGVPLQAVVMPAFEPEWAIWIGPNLSIRPGVCLSIAKLSVWHTRLERKLDLQSLSSKPRCEFISDELHEALRSAWMKVLRESRYPDKKSDSALFDTTGFYFAAIDSGVLREGQLSVAPAGSPVDRLQALTHELRVFVESPSRQAEEKLLELALDLVQGN